MSRTCSWPPAPSASARRREILGIPGDVQSWAMIPVGYPTGRWGEAQRRPVEETIYWDNWRETPTREIRTR